MLCKDFFNRDACKVAQDLLGKVIRVKYRNLWLSARITEAEAYYIHEKGSHASLGFTEKRKALFMPAGTIYMYYARGGDSFNVSTRGKGNAVLIKSAIPFIDRKSPEKNLRIMQRLNPINGRKREIKLLCAGQTLLCKSLNIKVKVWDQKQFDPKLFYMEDVNYRPKKILKARRRGIPKGRDEHLEYRFIDVT